MTHYDVLGVPRDAGDAQIRTAFRRLARQTHPDRGGSAEAFHEVALAYEVLGDARRRAEYDATLPVRPAEPVAGGQGTAWPAGQGPVRPRAASPGATGSARKRPPLPPHFEPAMPDHARSSALDEVLRLLAPVLAVVALLWGWSIAVSVLGIPELGMLLTACAVVYLWSAWSRSRGSEASWPLVTQVVGGLVLVSFTQDAVQQGGPGEVGFGVVALAAALTASAWAERVRMRHGRWLAQAVAHERFTEDLRMRRLLAEQWESFVNAPRAPEVRLWRVASVASALHQPRLLLVDPDGIESLSATLGGWFTEGQWIELDHEHGVVVGTGSRRAYEAWCSLLADPYPTPPAG